MAFAKKYEASFKDRQESETIAVELWKDTYVGASSAFVLGSTPVVRPDGRHSSDIWFPLRPSVVTLNLTSAASALINDIYSDEEDWWVIVKQAGAETFRGRLERTGRRHSLDDYGGAYQLRAHCGIGYLQTLNLFDTLFADDPTLLITNAKKTIAGWLVWIFDRVGYSYSVYTYSNYYAQNMTGADDPLAQENAYTFAWMKDGDDGTTVYDMLVDLMTGFVVHQRDGAWHCYSRRGFQASSFTRFKYLTTASGAAGTGTTDTYTSQVTASSPQSDRLSGGNTAAIMPARTASILYDHGAIENLILNGDFRLAESYTFITATGVKYWTLTNAATSFNGFLSSGGSSAIFRRAIVMPTITAVDEAAALTVIEGGGHANAVSDDVTIESTGVNSLSISLRMFVDLTDQALEDVTYAFEFDVYLKVTMLVGATTYYLKKPVLKQTATWEITAEYVIIRITGAEETESIFQTPALPGDGDLVVRLLTAVDMSGISYSGGVDPSTDLYWQSVRILPDLGATEPVIQASTKYVASVTGGTAGIDLPAILTRIGTGPTQRHFGGLVSSANIFWNNYGVGPQTGPDSNETRAMTIAADILAMTRLGNDVIEATYSNSVKPNPILAVVESGNAFLPVFSEYDYKTGQTRVIAPLVEINGFTPDFDAVADDTVASIGGRAGGGQAQIVSAHNDFLRNFSEWNALTTTSSNLTGVITALPVASISNEQAVLTDGKFVTIAGLNGGHWTFELDSSPTAPITSISVVSKDIGTDVIPAGSGVYPSTSSLVSVQSQTKNAIYSAVESDKITFVTQDYDSAAATLLNVSALPFELQNGWVLLIGPSNADNYEGNIYAVTLTQTEAASATTINISSAEVRVKNGDAIRLQSIETGTYIVQNAAEIVLRAKRDELIDDINTVVQTSLTLSPDKIEISGATTFSTAEYNPSIKTKTYYQITAPGSGMVIGDVWRDTDDGNRPYTYDGAIWQEDMTVIKGGNITTNTIVASALNVSSLDAITATMGTLTVNATLTMGASGEITNTAGDYVLNDSGLDFTPAAFDTDYERAVTWNSADANQHLTVVGVETSGRLDGIVQLKETTVGKDPAISLNTIGPGGSALVSLYEDRWKVGAKQLQRGGILFDKTVGGPPSAGTANYGTFGADSSAEPLWYVETSGPYTVWHAGNDGSGSGLDADLMAGIAAADYSRKVTVPITAGSSGAVGEVAYDASYLYHCYAVNTWRRVAHATW